MKTLEQKKAASQMKESRQKHKAKRKEDSAYKARTRTLIQMGGLVDLSGLREFFKIVLGDDLQGDLNDSIKAAQLVGAMDELNCKLRKYKTEKKLDEWRVQGRLILQNRRKNAA